MHCITSRQSTKGGSRGARGILGDSKGLEEFWGGGGGGGGVWRAGALREVVVYNLSPLKWVHLTTALVSTYSGKKTCSANAFS